MKALRLEGPRASARSLNNDQRLTISPPPPADTPAPARTPRTVASWTSECPGAEHAWSLLSRNGRHHTRSSRRVKWNLTKPFSPPACQLASLLACQLEVGGIRLDPSETAGPPIPRKATKAGTSSILQRNNGWALFDNLHNLPTSPFRTSYITSATKTATSPLRRPHFASPLSQRRPALRQVIGSLELAPLNSLPSCLSPGRCPSGAEPDGEPHPRPGCRSACGRARPPGATGPPPSLSVS
jgi:hypothetical protein